MAFHAEKSSLVGLIVVYVDATTDSVSVVCLDRHILGGNSFELGNSRTFDESANQWWCYALIV